MELRNPSAAPRSGLLADNPSPFQPRRTLRPAALIIGTGLNPDCPALPPDGLALRRGIFAGAAAVR